MWTLIFVLGLIAWLVPARLVRGETLTLRTRESKTTWRSSSGLSITGICPQSGMI